MASTMNKYLFIIFVLVISSCNPSQTEKEYIKNLEDKNKALEAELHKYRGESGSSKRLNKQKIGSFFTIGSAEEEVIQVMGEPSSYMVTAEEARKFYYGLSSVYFYKGKVISYDNLEGNLHVRVKR